MHIANPYQAVALNAVPNIVLHVQVHRIGARLPNPVQQLVIAAEGSRRKEDPYKSERPLFLSTPALGPDPADRCVQTGSPFPNTDHAHIRQVDHHVAHSVVVGGILLPAQLTHGFHSGFAKANPDIHMVFAAGQPGKNLNAAVVQRRSPTKRAQFFCRAAPGHSRSWAQW